MAKCMAAPKQPGTSQPQPPSSAKMDEDTTATAASERRGRSRSRGAAGDREASAAEGADIEMADVDTQVALKGPNQYRCGSYNERI